MDINTIVSEYIRATAAETAAKKRVAELKTALIDYARGAASFDTSDYTVIIKTTTSCRLDTKALYKDFPDIKDVYNRPTTSTSIITAARVAEEQKSA